ncbi:unnamed protein product [Parnassius apollo]|uniref:(apollo) hypothetical protein n=1 Tax=Parnassius apollo TaxID=110799 RepID=A0A8S3XWR3_PARAO|nr:unnamed protein product [Parnassius apollo]
MKVLLFISIATLAAVCGKVPDYIPKCKKSDPQIEQCLTEAIESMKPKLKNGIPELNIPALDPFAVPTLKLDRTASNLRLKAVIKNAKAYGGSNFRIEKVKVNLNNKYLAEVKLQIPKLIVTGDYDVLGSRILTADINGKGVMKGNITGVSVVAKGRAKPVVRDGVEYLQAEKVVTKLKIKNAQISLTDSERPAAALSAATFFNASPGIVLDILNPLIEETVAAVLKPFINKVLGTIPLNEIFVDAAPPS